MTSQNDAMKPPCKFSITPLNARKLLLPQALLQCTAPWTMGCRDGFLESFVFADGDGRLSVRKPFDIFAFPLPHNSNLHGALTPRSKVQHIPTIENLASRISTSKIPAKRSR